MILPTLGEIDHMPKINLNHHHFGGIANIEHITCVIEAIGSGISNNSLATEWISYSIELSESISRIVECKQRPVKRYLYVNPFKLQLIKF